MRRIAARDRWKIARADGDGGRSGVADLSRDTGGPAEALDKVLLRERMRARRAALAPLLQEQYSREIHALLWTLPEMTAPRGVHCYLSFGAEVRTGPIFERCASEGIATFAPYQRRVGGGLGVARWRPGDAVLQGSMGVPQPLADRQGDPPPESWSVVLVPGLAFDRQGARVGFGKGYYDRFLRPAWRAAQGPGPARATGPLLIGLAYGLQVVPRIAAEPWDVPLHLIVTEREVLHCH